MSSGAKAQDDDRGVYRSAGSAAPPKSTGQPSLRHHAKQMSYDDEPLSAFFTASSAAWNPMRLCVPSHNGIVYS
jgi:hypothetical protein